MEYITQHGYNPFKGHFLGFLSPGSNENNKMRGFILEDIDFFNWPKIDFLRKGQIIQAWPTPPPEE